jgi:hypothetical protein
MLLHQFIMVFVSAFKRFESVFLTVPDRLRRMVLRDEPNASDFQETETERAAYAVSGWFGNVTLLTRPQV